MKQRKSLIQTLINELADIPTMDAKEHICRVALLTLNVFPKQIKQEIIREASDYLADWDAHEIQYLKEARAVPPLRLVVDNG